MSLLILIIFFETKSSNGRDNGFEPDGFGMCKPSFPIEFVQASPISLCYDTFAIFAVHKTLSEILIWEKRFRAAGDLVSPRHKIHIEWSKVPWTSPFINDFSDLSICFPKSGQLCDLPLCILSSQEMNDWDWSIAVMHPLRRMSGSHDRSFQWRDEWSRDAIVSYFPEVLIHDYPPEIRRPIFNTITRQCIS
jgi:hypothetical protein